MQGEARLLDGRYEIIRRLGSGGMGRVYLARDRVLNRSVAIKLLRGDLAAGGEPAEADELLRRFRAEAQHSARLSHPNVVEIYDAGEDHEGRPYISMEHVPGITLADRLRREGGPLPPREAVAVAQGVALALDAAHSKGVIHRDIKPQNILLAGAPPRGVKVVDFGIAKAVEAPAAATRTNVVLGTVRYLSPEQAGGRPVEPASDLYSLGVVLYEMLTGTVPFDAENPVAVALKHVSELPPSPKVLNPRVSLPLADLTLRLLSKDPEGRPPTARHLVDELGGVLLPPARSPAAAHPTPAAAARPVRRPSRAKALLAASALLSALALPALFLADTDALARLTGVASPPNDPVGAVAEPLHRAVPELPEEPPAPQRETKTPAEPEPPRRLPEEPPAPPADESEPPPPADPPAAAAPDAPVAIPPPDPQRSQYAPQVQEAPAPRTREAPSPAPAPAPDPAPPPAPSPDPGPARPPVAAPEPSPEPAPAPPAVPQEEAEPSPAPRPAPRAQHDNADPPVPVAPAAPRAADPSPPRPGENARPGRGDDDPEATGGGRRG